MAFKKEKEVVEVEVVEEVVVEEVAEEVAEAQVRPGLTFHLDRDPNDPRL